MACARCAAVAVLYGPAWTQDIREPSPVPRLLGLLRSEDRAVRKAAIEQLAIRRHNHFVGAQPAEAVATLLAIQAADDEELADLAARTLAAIGPSVVGMFDFLNGELAPVPAAEAPAEANRGPLAGVANALAGMETTWYGTALVPELQRLAAGDAPRLARVGLAALASLGDEAAPATAGLLAGLGRHAERKWRCLFVLSQVGTTNPDAGALVVAALDDRDPRVRWWALRAALRVAPGDPQVVDRLIAMTHSTDRTERDLALLQIEALGPRAAKAILVLDALLDSGEHSVRHGALRALAAVGPPPKPVIARMFRIGMADDFTEVFDGLGRMGPAASDLVPALQELVRDALQTSGGHWDTRGCSAMHALVAIDRRLGVAELRAVARGAEGAFEAATTTAPMMVRSLGDAGIELLPELVALCAKQGAGPRLGLLMLREVLRLAKDRAPARHEVLPPLIAVLDGDDSELQQLALELLPFLRASAVPALPALQRLFERTRTTNPALGSECLRHAQGLGEAAIPFLRRGLLEHDPWTRLAAAESLLGIQPLPAAAVAAALPALDDPEPRVRSRLEVVLSSVRPLPPPACDLLAQRLAERRSESELVTVGVNLVERFCRPDSCEARLAWRPHYVVAAALAERGHRPPLTDLAGPRADVVRWFTSYRAAQDPSVREAVAVGLRAPPLESGEALPALGELLTDEAPDVVAAAAASLASHGRRARGAVPRLAALLRAGPWPVREAAAGALRAILAQ